MALAFCWTLGFSRSTATEGPCSTAPATGSVEGVVTFWGATPKSSVPDDAGVRRDVLHIDRDTHGLQYVVVYLADDDQPPGTPAKAPESQSPASTPATPVSARKTPAIVDQQDHEFVPRVAAVREGEPVQFTNSDAANHNVRTASGLPKNQFNVFTGIGGSYQHRFAANPQHRPIPLSCDIHPWMRGWVYVFTHDHFSVTDAQGRFSIGGVPQGDYRLIFKQPDLRYSSERTITVSPGIPAKVDLQIRAEEVPN